MHANLVVVNYDTREWTMTTFRVGSSLVEIDDAQIGRNLARLRGDMSQKELAVAMRERGHKWSQATVWNVERGERPLRLTEATALGDILELLSVYSITSPERHFAFRKTQSRLNEAQDELDEKVADVLRLQRQLADEVDAVDQGELTDDERKALEWEIGLAPAEAMRDRQIDMILTLRALREARALGHFTNHLLASLEAIEITVPDDIVIPDKAD